MTIGRKLYSSFGAVLAMVLVLFLVNLTAVYREHSAKAAAGKALQLADASDKVRFQMMQNRLYLSNYLLSGDSREVERMNDGARVLEDKLRMAESLAESDQQRSAIQKVQQTEQNWARDFATPLEEKRKEVDSGNATVAELQIFYLQQHGQLPPRDGFCIRGNCRRQSLRRSYSPVQARHTGQRFQPHDRRSEKTGAERS